MNRYLNEFAWLYYLILKINKIFLSGHDLMNWKLLLLLLFFNEMSPHNYNNNKKNK